MKALVGFFMLAMSGAFVGCALGFIYGWFCGVVARSREKLESHRRFDMKLWSFLAPASAVIVFAAVVVQGPWDKAIGLAVIALIGMMAVKGGIYWSIERRLKRDL